MSVEYRVRLEAFQGPLDLLLYLIRRAEVDVTDIPVAQIADQYVQYLAGIERVDIDLAGEFLVMAATLMEIKSRMLAPPGEDAVDAGAKDRPALDPRADLVKQLLAYKRFRDAGDALDHRRREWESRVPVARVGVHDEQLRDALAQSAAEVEIDDLTLVDLAQAYGRIAATVNFDRLGEHQVTYDDTPIELHAEDILDRLRAEASDGRPVPLVPLFRGRTRSEMIGLFLATLELVRRRSISVRQDAGGGAIVIGLAPESPQGADEPVQPLDP